MSVTHTFTEWKSVTGDKLSSSWLTTLFVRDYYNGLHALFFAITIKIISVFNKAVNDSRN
jgi:hypothetical protein